MYTEEIPLDVDGKFVNQISQFIPSSEYALKELLKNSYEADATYVNVRLCKSKLIITDNGSGMGIKGIKSLLVISKSTKNMELEKMVVIVLVKKV